MQFHLNGFQPGDPEAVFEKKEFSVSQKNRALPQTVDVLIIGCGPAGLTLAAQLSKFSDIKTVIVDQKPDRLILGQADGVACRTMEMFEAFGFSEKVLKEGYWVNETAFWKPDDKDPNKIIRNSKIQDTEDGLSEFPHMVLNQARVHDFYLDLMKKSPTNLEPHYSRKLLSVKINNSENQNEKHPVTAFFERSDDIRKKEIVSARYIIGCDGARSIVRKSLNLSLKGDSANQGWGVMDVLAITNFPDVRLKAIIHSADQGNLLIIPREGGYLIRLYIELDKLNADERIAHKNITPDHLIEAAQRILYPYTIEIKEIVWWSLYEIGQRLCDKFDNVPVNNEDTRIPNGFIVGDACHTHSPQAGQGMNVSMRDSFNLGWKLASVIQNKCSPNILHTYSAERRTVAKELIDFDRKFAKMFSAKPKTAISNQNDNVDPKEFQKYFEKHGRFTAGTAIQYYPSIISSTSRYQHLALGLKVGMRFHSAPVIRVADVKPMELGHTIKADGRWRIFIFANSDEPENPISATNALINFLRDNKKSPIVKFTKPDEDIDSIFDVRVIFQQSHREINLEKINPFLLPLKGKLGLRDYEKIFCIGSKNGEDIFKLREINKETGCLVVVRPDQHIANILPLKAFSEISEFFDKFMTKR
ncbi:FAD-dependent monooxygenase [Paracoccaceae bacterium]|nr:FAD-dependent monooxygenase [Paracoccaceae bacterium]